MIYAVLILGFILVWAAALNRALKLSDFDIRYFFIKNWYAMLFGASCTFVLGLSIEWFYWIPIDKHIIAFALGLNGTVLMKWLTKEISALIPKKIKSLFNNIGK